MNGRYRKPKKAFDNEIKKFPIFIFCFIVNVNFEFISKNRPLKNMIKLILV